MIVIPALDIRNGKCTQLVQGRPGTEKYYGDPLTVARLWEKKGAKALHLIDLDAALGDGDNFELVKQIKDAIDIPIQFGGGIRDIFRAMELLDSGLDRIILGTVAINAPELLKKLAKEYGDDRITIAVDSLGGKVVIQGWTQKTGIKTIDYIKQMQDCCFSFLVTDVDREGLLQGIDKEEFSELASKTDARICASGGISTQEDLDALDSMGIWGCVVGSALYEGKLTIDFSKNKK